LRAVIQRTKGLCSIDCKTLTGHHQDSFRGVGLLVLLGWLESDLQKPDLEANEDWILSRILGLRVFEDSAGKMNLSLADYVANNTLQSGILWVSQFTLAAELDSGFRPSFIKAMNPKAAAERYLKFCEKVRSQSQHQNMFGEFGADMKLQFTNWGPVTICLEK
jgi:D-tyrosyl-tRNA(Tyr) deacylase